VLLKYRVACAKVGPYRDCRRTALQDAQRAVGLVRFRPAEWHIDPRKIGVLGFSAGGHMVAAISNHFEKRLYLAVDAADIESCRPDFAVSLYPGHLAVPVKDFALNPDLQITSQTPPTFLLQAEDDPVNPVRELARLLRGAQEGGRRPRGDARVCEGRSRVRAPSDGVAHHALAAVRGGVAHNNRHAFEVNQGAPPNNGMHPIRDTPHFIHHNWAGRRVMPGVK
jgi:acetyl esterase/lipase